MKKMKSRKQKSRAYYAQARANARAVFEHYGLPQPVPWEDVEGRIYWSANKSFLARLLDLEDEGKFVRQSPGAVANHGVTAEMGWRETEERRWSMQIVLHQPSQQVLWRFETDQDAVAPLDVVGWFQHLVLDVMLKRGRDPWRVREGLIKRGLKVPLIEEGA